MTARALISLTASCVALQLSAQPFLVENGEPRAEIILSDTPTRMQRLAAEEFRKQIEKISGARLPIRTTASGNATRVFIGHSPDIPVTADHLEHGAYRMATGEDWLALVGDDSDWAPTGPFATRNGDIPRAQAEWEQIMGAPYGMPGPGTYKNRYRLPANTGQPDGIGTPPDELMEAWAFDERGSFNAVCGFLRRLGVRWYGPGEIGEVLPQLDTIELPQIDVTVRPDFTLRQFNFRFGNCGLDTALWAMRLGIRHDPNLMIAHGLARMTNREAVFAEHPDWFAVYGGKTDFKPGDSKCQLCYSNEALLRESVRYARKLFDTYPLECVSIMPPDGYTSICQCEDCKGKDSPERHERGRLSNHVWDFVNRVAKEVAKTHPDRKILNCAYGVYTLPPDNIDKLEPNVQVCIVGGRRPINKGRISATGETAPEALRAGWAEKTDNPLLIFENYPFTNGGWFLPSFDAHAFGNTVNATKGQSAGEDVWLTAGRDFATDAIGLNHLQVYFTARLYWGGPEADVDGLFEEYCRLFYGPAAEAMRSFIDHCQRHWQEAASDKAMADQTLELFEEAKVQAPSGSLYAQRLAWIDEYLNGLRMKAEQLGQKRGPVPTVRMVGQAKDVVIDGELDDAYWQNCATAATGRLRELQTGQSATFGTTFMTGWNQSDLYLAIRCEESPGEKLHITATEDDDSAIWYGDLIELEIATETHSYYQIAVSPSGAVADMDRGAGKKRELGWDAKAEVATRIEEDHWIVEMRLPITSDENDPLNQIVGRPPTVSLPWHLNICRQRVRENGTELSALSPTGTASFHAPMKFAHFYAGQSNRFESDPSVTDFALQFTEAARGRRADAFIRLAAVEGITDFQKSAALDQAIRVDKTSTEERVDQIPIDAVQKAARMHLWLRNGRADEVVSQFGDEDLDQWPFWARGRGFFSRGQAYAKTQRGEAADRDLLAALAWTSDARTKQNIHLQLGRNRESNLNDSEAALSAYEAVIADRDRLGGSDEFTAAQAIARILTDQADFDQALQTLDRIDTDRQRGTWRDSTLIARGDVHQASGQVEQARAAYEAVLKDPRTGSRFHQIATERLKALQ